MKNAIARFYDFLSKPLFPSGRVILLLLVVPLVLSLAYPLWTIQMVAPQYPEGLELNIYSYTIKAGHDGQDLREINILNHYIGMKTINRTELSDLDWIPFAIGLLALVTLRCAAIGTVRSLVDIFVLTVYVASFSMSRFVYKLYSYGHNLDPDAPVRVQPFTPAIVGSKQIANFTTSSYPKLGTLLLSAFAVGAALLVAWHLIVGRRRAVAEDASG